MAVLRVCFYFYIVKVNLWWNRNGYVNPDSTRSTIAKFCNRSTDKLESMQHKPSLRFQALSFRKPNYLFHGSRFNELLKYRRKKNHYSLEDPFVVVGSLQRYKRQFAGHGMLTPQSTPSSDAFENGRLSNPNKDTKRTRSLYSTPLGGFRCQLPGCRTCSNWHWKLIWPVSQVIPGLPSKLWIVLRVIPATNKNNNLDWKIQGNFFLPDFFL